MVKSLSPKAGHAGSIPHQGAKISHALWSNNQRIKQRQYCNKFNKDLKNGCIKERKVVKRKRHFSQRISLI